MTQTIIAPQQIREGIDKNDIPVIIQTQVVSNQTMTVNFVTAKIASIQAELSKYQSLLSQITPAVSNIPVIPRISEEENTRII